MPRVSIFLFVSATPPSGRLQTTSFYPRSFFFLATPFKQRYIILYRCILIIFFFYLTCTHALTYRSNLKSCNGTPDLKLARWKTLRTSRAVAMSKSRAKKFRSKLNRESDRCRMPTTSQGVVTRRLSLGNSNTMPNPRWDPSWTWNTFLAEETSRYYHILFNNIQNCWLATSTRISK